MLSKLAFIHTSHVLIPAFSTLARKYLPDVETFHMTDESLIRNTISAGTLTRTTVRRLVAMIGSAHEGGADAVMVTCSSIGPGVKPAREIFDFPVFRIDEPMAESAVRTGKRIGVAATLGTTLEPTMQLIEETAAAHGRAVEIVPSLCRGAFEAVLAGDTERHDAMVAEALAALRERADVIVLAQASMARVVARLSPGGTPILSSPELAMGHVRRTLAMEPVAAG